MKDQRQKVERENAVEALSEIVEKGLQVALLGNGFGHFEESFDLARGMIDGRWRSGRRACS